MIKKYFTKLTLIIFLGIISLPVSAQSDENGLGQTIQIYTRFHSFVGKPTWLLIIRDIDNNQNIPYLFDITKGNNFWLAFTVGRNYLISVSRLQMNTYQSRTNTFRNYRINNFCNLESNGRIIKGESLYITIEGDLFPERDAYTCNVSSYANPNFAIVKPSAE